MNISRTVTESGDLIISLKGELDAHGCHIVRNDFDSLSEETRAQHITLEMYDVTFMDSSGIGAIVSLFKRLKSRWKTLSVTEVRGQPRELMELLRVQEAIPMSWSEPRKPKNYRRIV